VSPPIAGEFVHQLSIILIATFALFAVPHAVDAQQNVPPAVQQTEADVESAVKRFGMGVQGGVGLDPEMIVFGAHATFGPIFRPTLQVRPGIEVGLGEVTTMFGINLDVLYTVPGFTGETPWLPYVGAGPNFSLSHRGFETEDGENVDVDGVPDDVEDRGRFDFSDTDFNGGMNFIVGMRRQTGMFFEMKATAWGVSNVRLLAGFNF
jgi:hypothetical protein